MEGYSRPFLEVYFRDYAEATGGVYRDLLLKYPQKASGAIRECIYSSFTWYYFYVESFIFEFKEDYLTRNMDYLSDWVEFCRKNFGITIEEVWGYICEHADIWINIMQRSFTATGAVVYPHDFLEFWKALEARQRLSSKMV